MENSFKKATIIDNHTLFSIFTEVVNNNPLKFASPHSNYEILLNSTNRFSYIYWQLRCEGELLHIHWHSRQKL